MPLTVGVQALVPPGQYLYCFDTEWVPGMAGVAVNPLDPALGIPWPLPPRLSDKDAAAPRFAQLAGER